MRSIAVLAVVLGLLVLIFMAPASAQTSQSCGNEGEPPCTPGPNNGFCDTGLQPVLRNCGCNVPGPFGICLIPKVCNTCENYTRRRSSIDSYATSWVAWALNNQRELAQDEPINTVMHLGTHNSFNTRSDGHIHNFPNHYFSMTDALRSGARVLAIDTHFIPENVGPARLCHGGDIEGKIGHPGSACIVPGEPDIVGTFPPGMRLYANGIKEIRKWLNANRNEIVFIDNENYVEIQGGSAKDLQDPLKQFGQLIFRAPLPPNQLTRWPTRRELLNDNKRVIVVHKNPTYDVAFKEGDLVGSFSDSWFVKNFNAYPNCNIPASRKFSLVTEDRSGLGQFIPAADAGFLEDWEVSQAAECNTSFIFMDYFSSTGHTPPFFAIANFSRQEAAVWSWKKNDRGQGGNCALREENSGRWISTNCQRQEAFACGLPRSESGLDPLDWTDKLGEDWKITAGSGRWEEGDQVCQAEFPGYVFGVPVNGYQNRKLKDANTAGKDLWLNYSKLNKNGQPTSKWSIRRRTSVNSPPIADAGPNQTYECSTTVTLDGSASMDPDGDTLNYTWNGPFGVLTGAKVTTSLAVGVHDIPLTVSDGVGGSDTDSVIITVQETAPSECKAVRVPYTMTAIGGTPQTTTVKTAFPTALQVTVKDQFGDPFPEASVVFTAQNSGASLSSASFSVKTDERGIAALSATANKVAGVHTVTASSSSIAGVIFTLSNKPGNPEAILATSGTPQSTTIGSAFDTPLRTTVRDDSGNLVPGAHVTYNAVRISNAGPIFPSGQTAVTNEAGQAEIAVRANLSSGTYDVSATAGTASTLFSLTNTPRLTLAIPALTSGPANQLGIAWTNPLSRAVTLTLTARSYDGRVITGTGIQNPAQLAIPANSQVAREATEIFGTAIAGRSGWIELTTSDSGGSGFFLLYDGAMQMADGGRIIPAPASRLVFPHINNSTIVHIVNTGTEALRSVNLTIYDNNGAIVGRASTALDASGGWSGRVGDLIPSLVALSGYAVIDTRGNPFTTPSPALVGMTSYQQPLSRDNAVVIAEGDSTRGRTGHVVHVVAGSGYSSRLRLVNIEPASQQVNLTWNGANVRRTIPGYGRLDEALDSLFALSGTTLVSGSLAVEVTGNSYGLSGFVEVATSEGQLTAEPVLWETQSEMVHAHVAHDSRISTSLALLNPNPGPAAVTIEVRSATGSLVASKIQTLEPGQRAIGRLNEFFPAIQNQVGGFIRVTSSSFIYSVQVFEHTGSRGGFLANVPSGN